MSGPALAARARNDPGVVLWVVAGVCWVGTAWLIVAGGDELGHHDVVLERSTWPWGARIGAFLGVWLVMVGAMMLPTVVPLVRLFVPVSGRAPRPAVVRAAFLTGYLAVWTAFAGVALLGDAGIHALFDRWSWLAARPELVLGGALVLAGAFQFSPLKNACLTACRNPVGFLWQHYRRGLAGAWRLGLRHGLSCLGCCWALMLLMFATGVGSLVWMIALTAVMVIEKTSRWGSRLVAPVGIALLVAGAAVSAPAVLGGGS
jgi:predicted metal-binding membrane protein